jgi:serine/threonine-protein kinase
MIPTQIGRYVIDRLLGSGAMGHVYLGRDPELDRAVAVKTVRNLELDDDALLLFLERFRNEARAAARLHHPSIVQVYDVGEDDEVGPFLVFEYVPGMTLKQVLRKKGALPPEQIAELAAQIGEALDVAHTAGIIHRDIKPDNLLVTADGRTKLADFGVAQVPNAALTREGQFLGTPCYAAPETLKSSTWSPRSDLFSFAAVLYEAASGTRAFPGEDAVAVAHKVIHDVPPPPSRVSSTPLPKAVDIVLMRGLEKRPEARYATPFALAEALYEAYASVDMLGEESAPAAIVSTPPEDGGSNVFAYGAVLVGLLVVGAAFAVAFGALNLAGPTQTDAGVISNVGGGDQDTTADPDRTTKGASSAELDASFVLTAPEDASRPDTAQSWLNNLSRSQREDMAKDAVDEARRLIEADDHEGAQRALSRAALLDPGNSDIPRLRARIGPP